MGTEYFSGTCTCRLIPIGSAYRTQAFAVYLAQRFHGKREQNLFAQDIANRELRARKKSRPRIFFAQLNIVVFVKKLFLSLTEEQIK